MTEDAIQPSFAGLGLGEETLKALEKKGFTTPTEIQAACIPLLLEKDIDVIGQAQTGTGKTAAFGLPILEKIDEDDRRPQALVLTPTRELAIQVADEIISLKGSRHISVEAIYGGSSYENQFKKLKRGIQVVVGTPGRIQDHLERGTLDLSALSFAVLDEADEMLDMGFIEDIEKILAQTNKDKRMLFFSATMPDPILKLATRFMGSYEIVRTQRPDDERSSTEQYYCYLRESDKMEVLVRIIDRYKDFYAIVFCRTKVQCEEIGRKLMERGYDAEALHGDLSQKQRELILQKLREHRINILVATDVAARGIDISELTHVINYTIPSDPEVYTHRIGRTGRAGREGLAITFVTPSEKRKFNYIKKATNNEIREYRVPSVDELMKVKKERMAAEVVKHLEKEDADYADLADALLEEADPQSLVKALLSLHYTNSLDRRQYHDVSVMASQEERTRRKGGKEQFTRESIPEEMVRLFIARGRKDHLTKRALADLVSDHCGVRDEDIRDIEVMDCFSFINVPERAASKIIEAFEDMGSDGRPLVVRAKEEDQKRRPQRRPSSAKPNRRRREWDDDAWSRKRDYSDDYRRKARPSRRKEHGRYNKKH